MIPGDTLVWRGLPGPFYRGNYAVLTIGQVGVPHHGRPMAEVVSSTVQLADTIELARRYRHILQCNSESEQGQN